MRNKNVIRTKTYYMGKENNKVKYLEINLFPFMETERKRNRKAKEKVSAPKQKNLNDKRAVRYFTQLLKANFRENDLHVTLTYSEKYLPEDVAAAEKEVKNYLRRIARYRKKFNLSPLKYVFVTEVGIKTKRIHHHIIMNADGIDRDVVENLWRRKKCKGEKQGEAIGFANADRLRLNDKGLDAIAAYLSKDPKGRKRWVPSQNLKKPELSVSDTKTSKSRFAQLVLLPVDCEKTREYFKKIHPEYTLTEVKKVYNEKTGIWSIYAKMTLTGSGKEDENGKRNKHRKTNQSSCKYSFRSRI